MKNILIPAAFAVLANQFAYADILDLPNPDDNYSTIESVGVTSKQSSSTSTESIRTKTNAPPAPPAPPKIQESTGAREDLRLQQRSAVFEVKSVSRKSQGDMIRIAMTEPSRTSFISLKALDSMKIYQLYVTTVSGRQYELREFRNLNLNKEGTIDAVLGESEAIAFVDIQAESMGGSGDLKGVLRTERSVSLRVSSSQVNKEAVVVRTDFARNSSSAVCRVLSSSGQTAISLNGSRATDYSTDIKTTYKRAKELHGAGLCNLEPSQCSISASSGEFILSSETGTISRIKNFTQAMADLGYLMNTGLCVAAEKAESECYIVGSGGLSYVMLNGGRASETSKYLAETVETLKQMSNSKLCKAKSFTLSLSGTSGNTYLMLDGSRVSELQPLRSAFSEISRFNTSIQAVECRVSASSGETYITVNGGRGTPLTNIYNTISDYNSAKNSSACTMPVTKQVCAVNGNSGSMYISIDGSRATSLSKDVSEIVKIKNALEQNQICTF